MHIRSYDAALIEMNDTNSLLTTILERFTRNMLSREDMELIGGIATMYTNLKTFIESKYAEYKQICAANSYPKCGDIQDYIKPLIDSRLIDAQIQRLRELETAIKAKDNPKPKFDALFHYHVPLVARIKLLQQTELTINEKVVNAA
jgi:hypothetical protein